MSNVWTKPTAISRRRFLSGTTLAGSAVHIGLPPLVAMFTANGTAWAAAKAPVETRFVLWFNGNGIVEKYWIPTETGKGYQLTPCLDPLASFREDMHVITGLDNPAARMVGPGNDHHRSMSALMTGTQFTGRGAGGPSIDQAIAQKFGGSSRFRSLQIGVSQESFGESIQRNMSWAAYDRPLPPEMLPHKLFDRLFGAREQAWVKRKHSVLDAVREHLAGLRKDLGKEDLGKVDEHLASIRDVERAIEGLPANYRKVDAPDYDGDMKDWPRIARLQSDLLAHAFASRQTRVASYMLTKCQGLSRFPWLGYTHGRHHDYTHGDAPANNPAKLAGQRTMRDICRWHVEEFAYLCNKLRSIPEGEKTVFDNTCLVFVHEHAEANDHKNNGMAAIVAGGANARMVRGVHSKMTGTVADLYLTVADDVLGAGIEAFPTASRKLSGLLG